MVLYLLVTLMVISPVLFSLSSAVRTCWIVNEVCLARFGRDVMNCPLLTSFPSNLPSVKFAINRQCKNTRKVFGFWYHSHFVIFLWMRMNPVSIGLPPSPFSKMCSLTISVLTLDHASDYDGPVFPDITDAFCRGSNTQVEHSLPCRDWSEIIHVFKNSVFLCHSVLRHCSCPFLLSQKQINKKHHKRTDNKSADKDCHYKLILSYFLYCQYCVYSGIFLSAKW